MMTTMRKKMGTLLLLTALLCGPQRAFACDEGQDDRSWPCSLEVRGSSVTLVGASFVWQASAWYVRTQGRSLSPMKHLAPQLYFAKLGQSPLSFEPQGMVVSERRGPASWSPPAGFYKPDEPYIPWRAKERNGTAYLVTYRNGEHIYDFTGLPIALTFLRSDDGLTWNPVAGSGVVESGGGSETDFELGAGGDLYAVTRNEPGDSTGWGSKLCHASAAALASWSCVHDPKKYDSPLTFTHAGRIYLIARRNLTGSGDYELTGGLPWSAQETLKNLADYSATPKRCSLWRLERGGPALGLVLDLPGWGDTCFPALLKDAADPDLLSVYNYSSPQICKHFVPLRAADRLSLRLAQWLPFPRRTHP